MRGGGAGRGGGQVSRHSRLSPLSPVFVPASAGGGGQGDATSTDTRVSNRALAGALEQPHARPIPPGDRAVSRAGGRAASASAISGGSASSVGATASAGTSTSDDLLLVAALRRSEASAAYLAVVDQAIIYGDLVRALLAAQARVDQVPLSPAGPGASGVRRRQVRSRRPRFSRGTFALASAGLRHATGSGAVWRRAFANGNLRRRTPKLPPPSRWPPRPPGRVL